MATRSRSHARRNDHGHGEDGDEARTAGRSTWTGSLSFGLLQIPVSLHPAESRAEEIHFRLLDKHDLTPVRYERVNASTGKAVEWKDIVKGYEYEKDNFVVLDADDLRKANVQKTQTIDIQDFVPRGAIDPAYFETPYYLVPNARAKKAYVLLREALAKKDAVAIATFVLRTREHLCAVMPVGEALMIEILRFGHELKDARKMALPTKHDADGLSARERAMAEQLIDGMMTDWEPSKYKDRYHRDVMKLIAEKAKTGETKEHNAHPHGTVANDVVDILDLLKQSVAANGRAANDDRPRPKGSVRKAAPRARRAKAASTRKRKARTKKSARRVA